MSFAHYFGGANPNERNVHFQSAVDSRFFSCAAFSPFTGSPINPS
jgi:hypothetical protein